MYNSYCFIVVICIYKILAFSFISVCVLNVYEGGDWKEVILYLH